MFFRTGEYSSLEAEFKSWNIARTISASGVRSVVEDIFRDFSKDPLGALERASRRFDLDEGAEYSALYEVGTRQLASEEWQVALEVAAKRILDFHESQFRVLTQGMSGSPKEWKTGHADSSEGQRLVPVNRVGVYVPGGNAAYPSSVLMNVLPAIAATVPPENIVVATPPTRHGKLHHTLEFACGLCGIKTVVLSGGATGIAALAFGLPGLEPVDIIVGPGNDFVNEAKRMVWGRVGLDNYAGPSEVAIWADSQCRPHWVAADLLSQVEHAPDNVGLLVVDSQETLDRVLGALEELLNGEPREQTMRRALAEKGWALIEPDLTRAALAIDTFAPEHLGIHLSNSEDAVKLIRNAGCILVGENGAQSAGDYILGPSHTLPTGRGARFGSPVNVMNFLKFQSISRVSSQLVEECYEFGARIGDVEGFSMHARALRIRKN